MYFELYMQVNLLLLKTKSMTRVKIIEMVELQSRANFAAMLHSKEFLNGSKRMFDRIIMINYF